MRSSKSAVSPARTRATTSSSPSALGAGMEGAVPGVISLRSPERRKGSREPNRPKTLSSGGGDDMRTDRGVESARQALRVAFGVVPFLAGLDKFFNLLADWPGYLSPAAAAILPVSAATFMHVVGVIEMAVGLAILTRWTLVGSWVAAVWLVAIALDLISTGRFLDVAVRDLVMATGAYALARLTEARQATEVAIAAQEETRR